MKTNKINAEEIMLIGMLVMSMIMIITATTT